MSTAMQRGLLRLVIRGILLSTFLLLHACASAPPAQVGPPDFNKVSSTQPLWITITADPWADIYIDDYFIGRTPIENYAIIPGLYTIRLVNSDLKIDYELRKTLEPEKSMNVLSLNYNLAGTKK